MAMQRRRVIIVDEKKSNRLSLKMDSFERGHEEL
jgi:hypothetical protein